MYRNKRLHVQGDLEIEIINSVIFYVSDDPYEPWIIISETNLFGICNLSLSADNILVKACESYF